VITIGIDPTIELGPVTIAWHGLTIAIGIAIGGVAVAFDARRRGLDPERVYAIGLILVVGALVGGRAFYLLEHGELDNPGKWFGTVGFTFYGGFIAAALGIAYYLRRARLSVSYLDAIAAGLPLGLAVGRIGDVINGEHYGPATNFFLGVRNTHADALTPSPDVAYHSGGLYEVLIGAIVFAIVWPLRKRLRRPLALMWLMLALFAIGRFFEFFLRSDSADLALGLEIAQWTSLLLLAVAAVGAWLTLGRRAEPRERPEPGGAGPRRQRV
jgi:phosphatidylglycerol:prolipoprotein diacylglycerol transferase